MKMMKKMIDKADNDVFDEIIKACEGKMVSPFKKEKMVVKIEGGDEEMPEEMMAVEKGSDMDEEQLEKLMSLYKELKG